MNNERKEILLFLNQIENILQINHNQSIKLIENIVPREQQQKEFDREKINTLFNYKECKECNVFFNGDKCGNCNINDESKNLLIFEKISDFLKLNLDFINYDFKYFNLNFFKKTDFLDLEKVNFMIKKIKKIILNFGDLKEINLIMIPTYEVNVFANALKREIKNIDVKILNVGVSLNSNINYVDEESMRKAFEKSEKI